ncbi:hypothetical protein KI387_009696, partial [Taxus chinensis]
MKVDVKSSTYLFKLYLLINVTSDSLIVTFAPINNSIAFINSIEVVSVPDFLTSNVPMTLSPLSSFSGLLVIALETSYRLNMGVDPDFSYFVCMHFCDIVSRSLNQLYFHVFINSQTALDNFDLSSKASNLATPYYTDFVVNASGSKKLSVSIGPSLVDNVDPNAILNGLEIMKMSNEAGSLDGPYSVNGLIEATNKFDETLLLGVGVGEFGKVYQGKLEDGTKVAVNRGNPRSEQGVTEFQLEIKMLSKLHHHHLLSLIGYCEEHCEMILVYEYMANGPLRSHLYGENLPSLSWKQRLEVLCTRPALNPVLPREQ